LAAPPGNKCIEDVASEGTQGGKGGGTKRKKKKGKVRAHSVKKDSHRRRNPSWSKTC